MAVSQAVLGKRLKSARIERHMTQEQAAEHINFSVAHLSKIERGIKPISIVKLSELCDVLNIPIEWVISGAVIPQNSGYNQQFGEIARRCSPRTVEAMLDLCDKIADIEEDILNGMKIKDASTTGR